MHNQTIIYGVTVKWTNVSTDGVFPDKWEITASFNGKDHGPIAYEGMYPETAAIAFASSIQKGEAEDAYYNASSPPECSECDAREVYKSGMCKMCHFNYFMDEYSDEPREGDK
jgi:hypothetical protein